ncbi:phage head-tail connector protein [Roseivivax marinus]|uniref:Phage head-tail connector protein n=1 Tax=Roseivivax marinus TaxID=1379903 RepID=W4HFI1_9RHOB|nr:portal protein [Roseivivax marinus]ETW10886.1 phage head-tail connector protein [Roseivivax marinus]
MQNEFIPSDVRKAVSKAQYRKTLREPIVARRQEVSELMRPLRDDWQHEAEGKPRGVQRYDGTAVLALDQAGASIYSMLTATDNIWAPLEFEEEWRKDDAEARAWINEVSRIVFRSLDPARDNFYNDAPEVILDSIGLGDGVFYSARQPGSQLFHSKAIPWRECAFDIGPFGEVSHFDRWYAEPLWNVAELFGADALPERLRKRLEQHPNEKTELLHTVYPHDGTNRVSSAHSFVSLYVLADGSWPLKWGGYRDMPYYVSRWGVGSGETYGLGRGIYALTDAQMVNEMSRTGLRAAQKIAEPPMAASDELAGILSMDPNALNFGALDERGNQLVQPINTGGNVGITLEMQDQRRQAIKDAFYHAMLSLVGSPTPSVVEILKNDERRDQSMGPNLSRVINEFFAPFIEGRYRELVRAGRIPPPPPMAQKAPLRVRFVSPLAKAHKAQAAQATLQTVRGIAEIAALDPSARHAINGRRAAKRVHDGLAAPDDILNTEEEIAALMQADQQQQQGAEALDVAERGSRAVESLARAGAAAGQAQE